MAFYILFQSIKKLRWDKKFKLAYLDFLITNYLPYSILQGKV